IQNKIILPNYTNPVAIKNQTIFAGVHGFISCPPLDFWTSSTILNSTGFSGVYADNRDIENQDTQNYVLRTGYDGTIILLLTGHHISTQFPSPPLVIYNRSHIKNDSIFLHHDGKIDLDSHPGVGISY